MELGLLTKYYIPLPPQLDSGKQTLLLSPPPFKWIGMSRETEECLGTLAKVCHSVTIPLNGRNGISVEVQH